MILLYPPVAAAYLAAAWLEWQALARAPQHVPPSLAAAARWLPPVALAGHAVLISQAVFTGSGLDLSLANALSAVAGLTALFAWMGTYWSRTLPGVTLIALPVAAAAVLLPLLFANPHRLSFADEPWAALHIAVALAAYALLIVAALQALLLMSVERRLHQGLAVPATAATPLLTLEAFLFRLVGVGYALLTLTLVSGILFSEQLFGKPMTFTHKTVFSVLGWLVFGGLLLGRYRYGWRGRVALRWILAGSGLLLLAYIGSKFVLEVILHR